MGLDHGELNLPLSKRGAGSVDAQIDRWKAAEARKAAVRYQADVAARKAKREAEKARPKFTADDLRGARLVRTSDGWHEVVRVSAKSVTVVTAYSWTDRIALAKVIEVRAA